jgi:hypothetical protein
LPRIVASKLNQPIGFGGKTYIYNLYLEAQYDRFTNEFCGRMRARANLTAPASGVTVSLLAFLIDGAGHEHDGPWVTVSPGTTNTSTTAYFATSCGSAHIDASFPGGGIENWTATVCR